MCYHCDAHWHFHWKRTHVCFSCRRTARGRLMFEQSRRCPACQQTMTPMPLSFQTPKRHDDRGWRAAFRAHWKIA